MCVKLQVTSIPLHLIWLINKELVFQPEKRLYQLDVNFPSLASIVTH